MKKEIVIIADYSETSITLQELCEICQISSDFVNDLIEYDIIYQQIDDPNEWIFDHHQLLRIKTALRLQRDLEVNLPGVAIVLDLLDQMEELRAKVDLLEKHFLR